MRCGATLRWSDWAHHPKPTKLAGGSAGSALCGWCGSERDRQFGHERMCRLFGFRSTEHLSTHHTLRFAENALAKQSTKHPDGWGIGYYLDDQPHVCKRAAAAFQDFEYARISDVVSSPTVIEHVRKATVGELSEHNSHPFRFKRWLGAHNGHIEAFPQVRGLLLDELPPPLVAQILGTTDSEHLFYLFLLVALQA